MMLKAGMRTMTRSSSRRRRRRRERTTIHYTFLPQGKQSIL